MGIVRLSAAIFISLPGWLAFDIGAVLLDTSTTSELKCAGNALIRKVICAAMDDGWMDELGRRTECIPGLDADAEE